MVFEVACPSCNGRLMAENPGTVVACPHCSAHLKVSEQGTAVVVSEQSPTGSFSEAEGNTSLSSEPSDSSSIFPGLPETGSEVGSDSNIHFTTEEPATSTEQISPIPPAEITDEPSPNTDDPEEMAAVEEPDFSSWGDAPREAQGVENEGLATFLPPIQDSEEAVAESSGSLPDFSLAGSESGPVPDGTTFIQSSEEAEQKSESTPDFSDFEINEAVNEVNPPESESPQESVPAWQGEPETNDEPEKEQEEAARQETATETGVDALASATNGTDTNGTEPVTETQESTGTTTAPAAEERTVSRSLFVIVASYASAVTIVFLLYLWMTVGKANPHQLESLPDVVPKENAEGQIERIVVSESAPMPPGHTLELGSTQRFGNLEVTPLRVTRGPLEFTHFDSDKKESKPPSGPVLKLWLRIKNVSQDQEFMPLGADLVFYRGPTPRFPNRLRANNFVCRAEEKQESENLVLHYDHVIEDVWNLKGQNIERGLKPGEEFTTYLPTAEQGISDLTGDLIWRVHLRKGLNPKTGWGITTLIEIEFHSDEIEGEPVPAKQKRDEEKSV